ncbi:uncharacterized protein EI90DRAFT_1596776 [Cantharellus anzutake]|uniref:uncharacterized protein n=1 Tax=Cantharellus anzutake TaxID=1750568 RepID=UPI0019081790|nr:uncharacterized protein EI90DRAFT_1596776 [Cantharellus anzutake]KAF8328086.1 hypothetical protein EI90DRAFT_1596776 [Cantharellus anzutake]
MASNHPNDHPLNNFSVHAGLLLVSEIGLVSFVLAFSFFTYCLRQVYERRCRFRYGESDPSVEPPLQPISLLFLCAILMDTIHATSNILSFRWVLTGEVTEGPYCTTQAALKQVGNYGVALYTIAIAMLTYLQVLHSKWLGKRGAKIFAAASVCFITLFIILSVAIPASTIQSYYGDSGMWCWVSKHYRGIWRIANETVWMCLAAPITILTYSTVVYKWLRQASFDADQDLKRDAISMGWYPVGG